MSFYRKHLQDFHIFISSEDNKDVFPNNNFTNFTTLLPLTIYLNDSTNTIWTVSLTDACFLNTVTGFKANLPESCVILSNIVEGSIIRGQVHPVLCQIWSSERDFKFRENTSMCKYFI